LNLKTVDGKLPAEFKGFYDEEKYSQSQEYMKANTKFAYVSSTFDMVLIVGFILLGGFNFVDQLIRGFELTPMLSGLLFFGVLYFAQDIISTPFTLYRNFVIEERFGFNQMTAKTFVLDKLKAYLLAVILGAIVLGSILFFFEKTGTYAWLYAWGMVSCFILILQPLYTTVIAPLFNKFTPLEDGELRNAMEAYAEQVRFPVKEICVMDGSRRSAHTNAYFSGFIKKRIALFDTLIEAHSTAELVAIIAHEVGHYKRKHILKGMIFSIIHIGVLFFMLSLFIDNRGLFDAFQMEAVSVYAGLLFFSLLYSPIELVLSIAMNVVSRKYEYEADAFATETTESAESLILALKNLSVFNLGHLTPHRLTVMLNYSHPPVLQRIAALRR
jgi:STE24 endopeptidase